MRILLIEDEVKVADFIKKGLKAENYQVTVASTGKEGLEQGKQGRHDLIILDLMLPDMGGETVCQSLRQKQIHTPLLVLTAKADLQEKVRALNTGADDYLTKPFAFEELLARIRSLLRRKATVIADSLLRIADLTLDPTTREVRRSTKQISLTPREFTLLEYMMQHPGKALNRYKILQEVWQVDYDTGSNVVDVCMKYLREKVDAGFQKKLIHTVRGIGYKLSD
jgi:DNA-binding response OmpR family regulator